MRRMRNWGGGHSITKTGARSMYFRLLCILHRILRYHIYQFVPVSESGKRGMIGPLIIKSLVFPVALLTRVHPAPARSV